MSKANFIIVTSFLLIVIVTLIAILIGRGYVPDFETKSLQSTGILVATSDPDAATVYIDGKLRAATNTTLNLAPGSYDVKIAKDGYSTWEKKIEIKKEEVIKTNVFLFPQVAGLSPLTLTGAMSPSTSLDQKKIAYGVASASAERNGVWILSTDSLRPLVGGSDVKLIYQDTTLLHLSASQYLWSPDGLQLLAYSQASQSALANTNVYRSLASSSATAAETISRAYLLDATKLNPNLVQIVGSEITDQLTQWASLMDDRNSLTFSKLDPKLAAFFRTTATNLTLALDENKVLYTATLSATVPKMFNYYLPGTNPTPEVRDLAPGNTYVYDVKEDRNYLIQNCSGVIYDALNKGAMNGTTTTRCVWFPSSRHILTYSNAEIAVMEYDGTNKSVLYTGPFTKDLVVPWPNWSKIIISTSLNSLSGGTNLYTINLR